MQNKIKDFFKDKERGDRFFGNIIGPIIYIHDKKEEENEGISIQTIKDFNVNSVTLHNENNIKVFYYVFQEYSLKKEILDDRNEIIGFELLDSKVCYRHCECILFPSEADADKCWILLVETKYAKDCQAASKKRNDYPHNMIEQIISTSEYLRRHGIIPPNKIVNALVAFPNLIINFKSTLFLGAVYRDNEKKNDIRKSDTSQNMNLTQIAMKYKVRIKPQNSAKVNSQTEIIF
jgi:hypothetical protein